MSILRRGALPIIAVAGFFCFSAPASAQPQEIVVTGKIKIPTGYEPVKKVVSIAGLDLSTPAGSGEMEKRVVAAIESICSTPPPFTNSEKGDSKLCSDYAWVTARPQMERAIQGARGH